MRELTSLRTTGPAAGSDDNERGSSLVEVLASMMILLFVLLSVLQLMTMALAVDRVAEAQTEMNSKAQAVIEIIRLVRITQNTGNSGILPLESGTRNLPSCPLDEGYDFWGPAGVGVAENEARFRLSYEVMDGGNDWIVTVFAWPTPDNGTGTRGYLGGRMGIGVRYASRIRK